MRWGAMEDLSFQRGQGNDFLLLLLPLCPPPLSPGVPTFTPRLTQRKHFPVFYSARLMAEAQELALGPRRSLPSPFPGPGGGEASPALLPTSISGVLLGKIYVPLRFGN